MKQKPCKIYFKNCQGFTLLENLIAILLLAVVSMLILKTILLFNDSLEKVDYRVGVMQDSQLVADYIVEKIEMAKEIELLSESRINLYTIYKDEWQWISFEEYYSGGLRKLGRSIGHEENGLIIYKRPTALIEKINKLEFGWLSTNEELIYLRIKITDDLLNNQLIISANPLGKGE